MLGDRFIKVELEGKGHATLTADRQQVAVDRVLGFFDERLKPQLIPPAGSTADGPDHRCSTSRREGARGTPATPHRGGRTRPLSRLLDDSF
jgi:hypothetical protein